MSAYEWPYQATCKLFSLYAASPSFRPLQMIFWKQHYVMLNRIYHSGLAIDIRTICHYGPISLSISGLPIKMDERFHMDL